MTDELVRGIRRIVGDLDEKPKGIGDAEARKPIGISRGIAYIGRDGGVSSSGSAEGGGNDTSPPNVPQPDTDPDNGAPGDTGGTNDGSTGGGTGTALTGDAATVDGQMTGGSEVGRITGTDPITGTLTTVDVNTLEGIEHVPPDGWENPDNSPPPDGWEEGSWWIASTGAFTGNGAFPQSSVDALVVVLGSSRFSIHSGPTRATDDIYVFELFDSDLFGGTVIGPFNTTRQDCDSVPNATFCPFTIEDVTDGIQPSDGKCAVVYDHAAKGYKGADNDPDCSADQKTASDFTIIRSQTQPDKYFRYTRLSNGGTKVTRVDSGGTPVPGSITKTIGPDGRVNGFFDVSLDAGIK